MDENIQELKESMLRLTDVLGNQAQLLENQTRIMMAGMKQEDIEKLKLEQVFGRNTAAVDGNTGAVDRSSRAYKANLDAAEEYNKAMQNYASALKGGADGLKKVFNNMISQDPSRSMAKYSDGLSTLGDAVAKAAENFGTVGKVVGATIQGFTKIAGMQMQQADLLLKANDQLAQFGTAGSFTTKELMDMAHGAGVTSKNMDTLINPIKSLGPALTSLGGSTGEGVKAFAAMTKVTNQQREEFQRLGVSQEQLIQNQADYVKLQQMSGKTLSNEAKDRAALQRASLEYTESLMTLSSLTGQDVESIKKKQQEASRAVEAQVAQINLETRARRLEAAGRTEEAALVRKEKEGRAQAINTLAAFDDSVMKGAREFLSTGTLVSDEAQALARLGLVDELKKLKSGIAAGGDAEMLTAQFQDQYNKKLIEATEKVGFSASRVPEIAKNFSMSENSMSQAAAKRNDSYAKELELSRQKIAEGKQPGKDPAQDARAKLTTAEIEVGKAMDKIVAFTNPLLKGFGLVEIGATAAGSALLALGAIGMAKATGGLAAKGADAVKSALGMGAKMAAPVATTVATAAAPAAATAAAPVAATAAGTAAAGGAGTAASAATAAGTALSKLAGPLTGLSKAAPLIGTVMSVGTGVVDAYQGIKKADKDLKEGKITKEEARVEKGEAVGGGTGTAAGGAAGALGGAKAGALIGAAAGPVGIAIGGILGAAVGGWLGSKGGKAIGEVAGGSIAKMTADADKKVDEASKKAETKKDGSLSKDTKVGSDVVKVSIVKVDDPNLLKALGAMTPMPKLGTPESTGNVGTRAGTISETKSFTFSEAELAKKDIKLYEEYLARKRELFDKELEARKKNLPKNAPAQRILGTESIARDIADMKAKEEFAERAEKVGAAKIDKPTSTAPKAAVGGIFEGPKSGYPVELHGKEAVVPLGTGMKTSGLTAPDSLLEEERDEELEKEIEALAALKKTMRETDASFDKLTASIIKLNKLEEEKLESTEDQVDGLKGANDKLKNVFNNVGLDLSKFASNIKVVTREASSSGTGIKVPEGLGGILGGTAGGGKEAPAGGAAGGTGVTPPSAPPLAGMGGGTGLKPAKAKDQDIKQNLGDVKAALMKRGMGDEKYLNAVLGNVMKETGGVLQNENLDYGKTSNERIRSIFGSRVAGKSDQEINEIKKNPEMMGEVMYGKDTKIGRGMGNTEIGDGFKYRGRGYIGITGKAMYAKASQALFGDDRLVKDPDLLNNPQVAAEATAWYMEMTKGSMAKRMGIDPSQPMTQDMANQLATSQVAGRDVNKSSDYIKGELLGKVSRYAASKDIQGIQPSSSGTMVASADTKKSEIPKAQRGGVFDGPDSGYLVELHGPETVIPNDKIASIAKKELESVTKMSGSIAQSEGDLPKEVKEFFQLQGQINSLQSLKADDGRETFSAVDPESQRAQERMFAKLDEMMSGLVSTGYDKAWLERGGDDEPVAPKDIGASLARYTDEDSGVTNAMKKLMPAGMISDSQSSMATAPSADIVTTATDTLKDITDNTKTAMVDALKSMQDEFKITLSQIMQRQPDSAEPMAVKDTVTELLSSKLDMMIDKLSQSNDTQDKLLQYSKV